MRQPAREPLIHATRRRAQRTKSIPHKSQTETKEGAWTNDISNAAAFRDHSDAVGAKQLLRLHEVELYYSFDQGRQSQWDFTMKL